MSFLEVPSCYNMKKPERTEQELCPFRALGWRGIFTHPVGAGKNPDAPIWANGKNNNSTDRLHCF
ncbi:MAG: hypothetical protein LBC20_08705 [Planctomycetaceae bacterium]|jgi:hypothetical protein|nr:hypothetical protein [Planctomycetaceae bacterium]